MMQQGEQKYVNHKKIAKYIVHSIFEFGVKAKENQDKVPTLYWLPKLHKNPLKQVLLQILVLVRQQNFLNC